MIRAALARRQLGAQLAVAAPDSLPGQRRLSRFLASKSFTPRRADIDFERFSIS